MRNLTIAAAVLMASSSVLAQTAQPTTATPTGTTAPQASSAAGTTEMPAAATATASTMPDPAPTASDAASTASIGGGAAAAGPVQAAPVAATMTANAEWSAFDADNDGALSPLEFAMHADSTSGSLTAEAKRERFSRASGNGAIKLLNATAADFSKADKNQDRKVDSTELAGWQSGGASASAPVAVTSGAGEMTPMPSATRDAAEPADTSATMTPSDASDVPEGQQADDTMATDTPPKN